ncbi:MAG TPA: O-methyltransferase [Terracidiphilus sp.]
MSKQSKDTWANVDRYFSDALVKPNRILDSALKANRRAQLPAIDVTPLQGRFLEILVRAVGARRVLEIGTLGGYSTLWLARALPDNGHIVTLEVEAKHASIAQRNIDKAHLSNRVDLRIAPAAETLAALVAESASPFDMIFIDADKAGYPDYLKYSLKLSRPGTLIVADNVVRDGKVIDSRNADPNIRGVRRFTKLIAAERRLSTTVLQTVGGKGYDGFAIAIVLR